MAFALASNTSNPQSPPPAADAKTAAAAVPTTSPKVIDIKSRLKQGSLTFAKLSKDDLAEFVHAGGVDNLVEGIYLLALRYRAQHKAGMMSSFKDAQQAMFKELIALICTPEAVDRICKVDAKDEYPLKTADYSPHKDFFKLVKMFRKRRDERVNGDNEKHLKDAMDKMLTAAPSSELANSPRVMAGDAKTNERLAKVENFEKDFPIKDLKGLNKDAFNGFYKKMEIHNGDLEWYVEIPGSVVERCERFCLASRLRIQKFAAEYPMHSVFTKKALKSGLILADILLAVVQAETANIKTELLRVQNEATKDSAELKRVQDEAAKTGAVLKPLQSALLASADSKVDKADLPEIHYLKLIKMIDSAMQATPGSRMINGFNDIRDAALQAQYKKTNLEELIKFQEKVIAAKLQQQQKRRKSSLAMSGPVTAELAALTANTAAATPPISPAAGPVSVSGVKLSTMASLSISTDAKMVGSGKEDDASPPPPPPPADTAATGAAAAACASNVKTVNTEPLPKFNQQPQPSADGDNSDENALFELHDDPDKDVDEENLYEAPTGKAPSLRQCI